jgi:hypothetical protein
MFPFTQCAPTGLGFVRKRFDSWPSLRRLIAVAAAYAIALSGLIASFNAVRIAASAADPLASVICERAQFGNPAPGDDHGDLGKSCCVGCLIQLGAVPPPPTVSVSIEQSAGELLALPIVIDFRSDPQTKSHRSRAPPQSA